jgi:CpeS-like protein
MMTISDFFQLRAGKWVSQRTSHYPIIKKSESRKSEIGFELLPLDAIEVVNLCRSANLDPSIAICGAKVTWLKELEKQGGASILVAIAEGENQSGKLLLQEGTQKIAIGRYLMGEDEILNLIIDTDSLHSEEKLWFPRPNVCMRAGITTGATNVTSYCTEIRKSTT